MNKGKFVISLDFELMWGVFDVRTIQDYGTVIKNVGTVIKKTLEMFEEYNIEATFSMVGLLGFDDLRSAKKFVADINAVKPSYDDGNLSSYNYLNTLDKHTDTELFFATHLIKLIQSYKVHEISTHTFSHYYCLEPGSSVEAFRDDLLSAKQVHKNMGLSPITSIIFPRNQYDADHLKVCLEQGIFCYRGNENSTLYKPRSFTKDNYLIRILRLLDSYVNLTGFHTTKISDLTKGKMINIPSSRIFRSYQKKLRFLEKMKIRRIKKSMSFAAKKGEVYHLWWHPHNFGSNMDENFLNLQEVCKHFAVLKQTYDFESISMSNLANRIKKK